ncbi:MAG: tetratricopeptide repeat protein [Brevinema sp.]
MKNKILYFLLYLVFVVPVYALDQATFKVGKSFFERGLYTEAERRFLDIVRKYPDSPLYHQSLFYLGQTYAHLGKYKPALQYYKLLLTKSKTIKEKQRALLGIAKSWLQIGEHGKAGDFYSFFVTEYPESEYAPAALFFAGIARERDNDTPAAIEKYRAVLNEYPDSEYYAKAIEKIAVLDRATPESLWEYNNVPKENIWEPSFERTDLKAQSTEGITDTPQQVMRIVPDTTLQAIAPQVITQFIQTPIVITQMIESPPQIITQAPMIITQTSPVITQTITQVVTQQNLGNNTSHSDELYLTDIVQQKDGVFIPVMTAEQKQKQQELERYKKIWEEEYQLKMKEQELQKAKQDVKDLAQLSEDKAAVLDVKEKSLKEQQDRIHNNIYYQLNTIQRETNSQVFNSAPLFTQPAVPPSQPTPQMIPTETPMIGQEDETAEEYNDYPYDYYGYDDYEEM